MNALRSVDDGAPHDLRGFFDRAHLQNIIGMFGAGLFMVLFSWPHEDHRNLLLYLAAQWTLIAIMGAAFYGRFGGRRDADGIPSLALPTIAVSHVVTSSVPFLDLRSGEEKEFMFAMMVVIFACIAGGAVTLGPVRRLARTAQISLLAPMTIAAAMNGYWIQVAGTVFFVGVVTIVGAEQMHQAFQEPVRLRAESAK